MSHLNTLENLRANINSSKDPRVDSTLLYFRTTQMQLVLADCLFSGEGVDSDPA